MCLVTRSGRVCEWKVNNLNNFESMHALAERNEPLTVSLHRVEDLQGVSVSLTPDNMS
jgi:hypothetical protein